MLVIKFGGSSVANAERILVAARIVASHWESAPVVVVVSAMAGVTDALIEVAEHALIGWPLWRDELAEIGQRHREAYLEIVGQVSDRFCAAWASLETAAQMLAARATPPENGEGAMEIRCFSGWGERLIVDLFAQALRREGIEAEGFSQEPVVLASNARQETPCAPEPSILATRAWLFPQLAHLLVKHTVPVLPGYIARTAAGQPTTLGRNGSDHSAAIVSAALGAHALYIYSDLAGVYTADPRIFSDAQLLPTLSYAEVATIAAAGARVLHPRTVEPLARWGIPLYLRSSFVPTAPGTDILPPAACCMPINVSLSAVMLKRRKRKKGQLLSS